MDKEDAKAAFDRLFKNVDGFAISRQEKAKLNYYYEALVYGEIIFDSFYDILQLCQPKENEIFYDLGSGVGKPVVLAALCFPFRKCIGIEKFAAMQQAAIEVARQVPGNRIEYHCAELNNYDFSDGDVIFINSYYFYYEMRSGKFLRTINSLKKGARVITGHTPVPADCLKMKYAKLYPFSWGNELVFVNEKI